MFPPNVPVKVRVPGSREYEMITFVPAPCAYEGEVGSDYMSIRLFEPRTGIEASGRDFMKVRAELHGLLLERLDELEARDGLDDVEAEQFAHLRRYRGFLRT
jgi:hypothetical protein